jgi:hypothetical protein
MGQQNDLQRSLAARLCLFAMASALAVAFDASAASAAPATPQDSTAPPAAKAVTKPSTPAINIEVNAKGADEDADDATNDPTHRHGARARIEIGDRDFDSFANAMQTAPWLVGLVFLVVGSIFLTPLILLVGIIWYKLRKTRLQNDALLKLAERGVVPSAQVADAVASGQMLAPASLSAAAGTTFEQAVATRRRAVWSDLRKGVILTTIGLSFVFYSMTDSGSANWVGLLLMFLGVGYIVLWWLEDRHLQKREVPPGPSGGAS